MMKIKPCDCGGAYEVVPLTPDKLICPCQLVLDGRQWKRNPEGRAFNERRSKSFYCKAYHHNTSMDVCQHWVDVDSPLKPKCFGCIEYIAISLKYGKRPYRVIVSHSSAVQRDLLGVIRVGSPDNPEYWIRTYALNGRPCWFRPIGEVKVMPFLQGLDLGFGSSIKLISKGGLNIEALIIAMTDRQRQSLGIAKPKLKGVSIGDAVEAAFEAIKS